MPRGVYPRNKRRSSSGLGLVGELEASAASLEAEARRLRRWARLLRAVTSAAPVAPMRRRPGKASRKGVRRAAAG